MSQRFKHATRIESQKHGHYLTLFSRWPTAPDVWGATCVKCGQVATVNMLNKKLNPLVEQCNERKMKEKG